MKITKSQLKLIIKEELENVLSEQREWELDRDRKLRARMMSAAQGGRDPADLERERKLTKNEMEKLARMAGKGRKAGWPDPDAYEDWSYGKLFAEFERKKEDIERACKEQISVLRKEAFDAMSAAAPWAGKESGESGVTVWARKQLEKLGLE